MTAEDVPARRTQEFAAIGRTIELVMAEKGLSKRQVADRSEIDYKRVSLYCKGQANPTYAILKRLCDAIGVSLGELTLRAEDLALEEPNDQGQAG
jgi:transcriptional regulator with XRE-family HTH domain